MASDICGKCGSSITVSDDRRYTTADRDAYKCSSCGESSIIEFDGGFVNENQALNESWISEDIDPRFTDSSSGIKIFDSETPKEEIAVAFLNEKAQREDSAFLSFQAKQNTILATRQDSAIGYIIWDNHRWEDGTTPRLLQIFVKSDERRHGVGNILLNYFEETYVDSDEFFFVHNPEEEMFYLLAATNHLELEDDELVYVDCRWQGNYYHVPEDIRDHVE
ncbi:GNAT family N-acetyltransferase [Halorubrum ezzemoulense]|uniref:GNAT family N-acetyltransferase n=1 Tax=Halorubrum ezzemoulense TaxID=337243 RepID=UPI00232B2D47|nr:GNAT family N-acetyltransferase [Halorubrum ezzemoulense]MDB2262252.1 GNAT family N-acetyltransferase [Halorubrum ezzemoulense]MDB2269093.1 GNAT family N-acetyltransferase [Halorubrum ezzemoulense]